MPDITMCTGGSCPFKDECLTHTAAKNEAWQSFFATIPYNKKKNECKYFVSNEERA
jgi:hypothetical protein